MLKVLTLHFVFFVMLCKLQGEWHAQQCIKNQDAIHIASIMNFSTRKQNAIPAMSQPAPHAVSWSVRGFAGPPQVSQPTAADPEPNRLHTGKRWHPNPQNPHEVQLRKKIDMKWEREKRRRKNDGRKLQLLQQLNQLQQLKQLNQLQQLKQLNQLQQLKQLLLLLQSQIQCPWRSRNRSRR